jgi:hypothetical protein
MNRQSVMTLYEYWSHAVTDALTYPWKLWDAHCQIGMTLVQCMMDRGPKPTSIEPGREASLSEVERLAVERLRQGLAPPREVYEAPYRDRVPWSDFPAWARPTDPELFEGCSHEG